MSVDSARKRLLSTGTSASSFTESVRGTELASYFEDQTTSTQEALSSVDKGSKLSLDELYNEDAGLIPRVVHIEPSSGKRIEEVYEGVHSGPVLGSGISGLVRLVTHKTTGIQYALKSLDLGLVGTKEELAQLREGIAAMCQLDHPNIVRLEEVYESHSEIYLIQELCVGGELFDRLKFT